LKKKKMLWGQKNAWGVRGAGGEGVGGKVWPRGGGRPGAQRGRVGAKGGRRIEKNIRTAGVVRKGGVLTRGKGGERSHELFEGVKATM